MRSVLSVLFFEKFRTCPPDDAVIGADPSLEAGCIDRRRKIVTLDLVAFELAQAGELRCRLDALGDHPEAQTVAKIDDCPDDDLVIGALVDVLDEALVDLETLDQSFEE